MSTATQNRPSEVDGQHGLAPNRFRELQTEIVNGLERGRDGATDQETKKLYSETISAYQIAEKLWVKIPRNQM
jgi:hypothetical protein